MNEILRKFVHNVGSGIVNNKKIYYILNLTWGLPLTLVGFLLTVILLPFGAKIHKYGHTYYVTLPKGYFGFSLGTTVF
jgi:hypothetical protein